MPKKLYTSEELNNPLIDDEAPTIEPREHGEHHKPSESVNPSSSGRSQDADRHIKNRHKDSGK